MIGAPRGLGAMIAFDVLDADGRPDGTLAKQLCNRALEAGLLLLTCGPGGQSVRTLVPLTISNSLLEEGLAILDRVTNLLTVEAA